MMATPAHAQEGHRGSQPSPKRQAAYALAIFPLEIVHRSTIRAMLPAGRIRDAGMTGHLTALRNGGTGTSNVTSKKYQDALRLFDQQGWIERGKEFLRIRDRQALLDHALLDADSLPAHFLALSAAIRMLQSQSDSGNPGFDEQRRQELLAVMELMKADNVAGSKHSGRGAVRFVPKGKAF